MTPSAIGLTLLVLGATPLSAAASSAARNGACFDFFEKTARYCAPPLAELVNFEVTEKTLWAGYEDGLVSYVVEFDGRRADLPVPQDIDTAFSETAIAKGIAGVNPPVTARALMHVNDLAVVEIAGSNEDLNAFFVYVISPTSIASFTVVDNSPEFDGRQLDWTKVRSAQRYRIELAGHPLASLSPIADMELIP
ncbi:hypothetical protein [Boseongicola aestuarii]|uniref:Uncharacterized protein n=1 Tax=Boseongicola aestuarii TaxID=1470561 RepID=A0A238IV60_9RHOB|nr:hypothetical protein [Boseongicola aestuarii]SMX22216.1 hypothetical protein BOA8489_00306 [Boseongicola aestuarii]